MERKERWAFSASEIPERCNSNDELHASVGSYDVLVKRNGEITNRYADGTIGVTSTDQVEASACEDYAHPVGHGRFEGTETFADVICDEEGRFLRFEKLVVEGKSWSSKNPEK